MINKAFTEGKKGSTHQRKSIPCHNTRLTRDILFIKVYHPLLIRVKAGIEFRSHQKLPSNQSPA